VITTMGIKAADMGIDLAGTTLQITKHMAPDPRRVGRIDVTLQFPPALAPDEKDRTILERTGNNCPVQKSLHPDIQSNIVYQWNTQPVEH
jgi:uncharacterized OsmC-like protein